MHYFLLLFALALHGCDKQATNNAPLKSSPLVVVKTPTIEELHPVEADHGHSTQRAHTHSAAKLQIIAEANQLSMDISVPSSDAVGFEDAPGSEAEKTQLTAVLNTLQAPDDLFEFSTAAGCTLKRGTVTTALLNPQQALAEHADFDMHYEWSCADTKQIKNITVNLFSYFKSLEKITVDYIVNAKQGGIELRRSGPTQIAVD